MMPINVTSQSPVNITTPCKYQDYGMCLSEEDYVTAIEDYVFPRLWEWVLVALYIIVFVVGLVGNWLVCVVVWRSQHMHTVTNCFIVNLSVADLMVILICLPPSVVEDVAETWFAGGVMCKLVKYVQAVSVTVSVLTLTVVAVERYYAICHPLKFKSTMTRTRVIICITWLLAMAVLVPELVVLDIHPGHEAPTVLLTSCRPTWDNQVQIIYQTFIMVALFFLPIAIIGYCYTHVCVSLLVNSVPTEPNGYTTVVTKKWSMKRKSSGKRMSDVSGVVAGAACHMEQHVTARRNVVRMLIVVVIVFIICYLPVHLLNICRYLGILPPSEITGYLALMSHWLCYFNSAINPVIYSFMSAKFRSEFAAVCRRAKPRISLSEIRRTNTRYTSGVYTSSSPTATATAAGDNINMATMTLTSGGRRTSTLGRSVGPPPFQRVDSEPRSGRPVPRSSSERQSSPAPTPAAAPTPSSAAASIPLAPALASNAAPAAAPTPAPAVAPVQTV